MIKRIIALFFFAFGFVAVSAQNPDPAKLDRYFETLSANDKFMGSVSVFRDGAEIYSKSVGFADMDRQIEANKGTKYRIGSISKVFTAVGIFQAVDAGKLSLSDIIGKYFPTVKNSDKITIAHLLGHRSGIHNFTADKEYMNWHTQYKDREAMTGIISAGGSDFEPGAKTQYSNSNYVLLTYILEDINGKPFAEQLTKPAALRNTYLGEDKINVDDNESNSYKYFDKWRVEAVTNPSITLGAGGIVSTPASLNLLADALWGGRLVSANSLSMMQTVRDGLGMGLFAVPFYDKTGYGHSGGIDGFHSMLIYFPEDKLSYAITSNGLNCNFNDIHIAVLSWAYGKPFDIPDFRSINLTSEDLDEYTGVYSSSQLPLKLTVTKNGKSLMAQGTGQPSFPLEPVSEHIFGFAQGGIVMEFNPREKTMILKQGGGVFYFKKE